MQTHDHIDRAAEIIYVEVLGLPDYNPDAVDDHNRHSYRGDCDCNHNDRVDARHAAEELDAAGLLATPEHDAAVAARALRDAAAWVHDLPWDDSETRAHRDPLSWMNGASDGVEFAVRHLDDRADRIEREGGAS